MSAELERRVRRHLESYDEPALVALASKGLLRRARKDLKMGEVSVDRVEDAVWIAVGGERVSIDDRGPKQARCTCPAQEICRHILTAILFLKSEPAEEEAVDPAQLEAELLAIDLDALAKWAGKRILREAIAVLAHEPEPQIEVREAIRISFPESMVEVRWFAGAGLDGAITTSRGPDPRKFVAAAVIAFQRSKGRALALEDAPSVLEESEGAPRDRGEVIASANALFEEMIGAGLAHAPESVEARLTTLSISALGVNLPRLALDLKRIADEVVALNLRLAHADEARLFAQVARAYALGSALARAGDGAPAELVGWHRTRYREVGTLELAGLGAYAWRTSSGFEGLTVVFREAKSGEWHSWSDARPAQYADSSPEERYRASGPWEGMRDPALASRSRFSLFHARRNEKRRLSASTRSKAQVIGPLDPRELDLSGRAFCDFELLRAHVEQSRPAGLGSYDPLADLVIVRPARFGARSFDEIRQLFVYEVQDEERRTLPLVVAYGAANSATIEALEKLDPKAREVWGVLGRAYLAEGELRVRPFSLYLGDGVLNLGLDGGAPRETEAPIAAGAELELDEEREREAPIDSATAHRIRSFESVLEEIAEIGRGALTEHRRQELTRVSRSLDDAGLPILARAARAISEAGAAEAPGRILRGRYLAGLHRELSSP